MTIIENGEEINQKNVKLDLASPYFKTESNAHCILLVFF